MASVYCTEKVLQLTARRAMEARAGVPGPDVIGSLAGTWLEKYSSEAAISIAGASGVAWSDDDPDGNLWSHVLVGSRATSIAGGTDQIQRNIIGEKVLGLPREPRQR